MSQDITLRSKQQISLLMAMSEGTIESLSDIYIDGTKLDGYSIDFAYTKGGTNQPAIYGFDYVGGGAVNANELTAASGGMILGTFTGDHDFVDITVNMPNGMYWQMEDQTLVETDLKIMVLTSSATTGSFKQRPKARLQNTSLNTAYIVDGYITDPDNASHIVQPTIHKRGKSISPYSFTIRVERPDDVDTVTPRWRVKLIRWSPDAVDVINPGEEGGKTNTMISYQTYQNANKTTYAGTALLAIRINDASEVSNRVPTISAKGKMMQLKVPVDTYYDTVTRVRTGTWNGDFNSTKLYTNNLAWVIYNAVSDALTKNIPTNVAHTVFQEVCPGVGVPESHMAKYTFEKFAAYCDNMANGERRYTFNGQLVERKDAEITINDLLTIGNAHLAEMDGLVTIIYDKELTESEINLLPIFTNQNIDGGMFMYSNSHISENYTQINVTIQNKDDQNKTKTVIVSSQELVQFLRDQTLLTTFGIPSDADDNYFLDRYGYNTLDIVMQGTTSDYAATRKGRALLWDSLLNNEFVSFKTLVHGASLYKGKVIRISDAGINNTSATGIIVDHSSTGTVLTLTLDRDIILGAGVTSIFFYRATDTFDELELTDTVSHFDLKPTKFDINEHGTSETPLATNVITIDTTLLPRTDSLFAIQNSILKTYTVVSNLLNDGFYETSAVKYSTYKFTFVDGIANEDVTKLPSHRIITKLKNNPIAIVSTDYLTNGTPTKGIHVENNDAGNVHGTVNLRWEHDDDAVLANGETVYYDIEYNLSILPNNTFRERVGTKYAELNFTTKMPTSLQLVNLLNNTFIIRIFITAKSNISTDSKEVQINTLYTINPSRATMIEGTEDDYL